MQAGVVSSGNSLDYTTEDFAAMSQTETAIKEMEAAAIAWVADMFGTPMFCLKSVTDIVDGEFSVPSSLSVHQTAYGGLNCCWAALQLVLHH